MKHKTCFSLAMTIVFALFTLPSCNDSGGSLLESKVSSRADDCMDCDHCCCYIELDGMTTSATLQFCGTADGASACSETTSCGNPFGGGQFIVLNTTTPRKLFCMGFTSPFTIYNLTTNSVDLVISCQAESGIPQTLEFTLEENGAMGDILGFGTNNVCIVGGC